MCAARRTPEDIRAAIVLAAIQVVGEQGIAALTHRAVAERAGVSLSSTTYHYASKAAIVEAALRFLAEAEQQVAADAVAAMRAAAEGGSPPTPAALVEHLSRATTDHGPVIMRAGYELQLQATVDDRLRPIVRDWLDVVAGHVAEALELLGSPDPRRDAHLLAVATDGLRLYALTTPGTAGRMQRETLEHLVGRIFAGTASGTEARG
ncbi:TetR/AcrR family transcriptional regulator [Patulibacter minatonensis]|uniref:TetR/AcrR family transcriptional regulator n=1 Tax=Patulibacter minatonensis TaxID=298163 RepID=UPI0004AC5B8D|nr:TetR/AcrR family transcriptional regulator [Patulibacter minatonensis]